MITNDFSVPCPQIGELINGMIEEIGFKPRVDERLKEVDVIIKEIATVKCCPVTFLVQSLELVKSKYVGDNRVIMHDGRKAIKRTAIDYDQKNAIQKFQDAFNEFEVNIDDHKSEIFESIFYGFNTFVRNSI